MSRPRGRVQTLTVTETHRRPNSVPLVSKAILWQFEFEDEDEDEIEDDF
jgi:hypothetical protein